MQAILINISTGALVPSASPVIPAQGDVRTLFDKDICPRGTISSTLTLDPLQGVSLEGTLPE